MLRHGVTLILAGSVSFVFAADCSDMEDESRRLACYDTSLECMLITSDEDRLKCFDGVFRAGFQGFAESEVQTTPSSEVSSEIKAREAELAERETEVAEREAQIAEREAELAQQNATAEEKSEDEFGKRWRDEDEPIDFIEATIVELQSNPFKVDYIRLDNGQVWREASDSGVRFKVGDKVVITEGIMGSFDLQVESSSRYIKVKRLR